MRIQSNLLEMCEEEQRDWREPDAGEGYVELRLEPITLERRHLVCKYDITQDLVLFHINGPSEAPPDYPRLGIPARPLIVHDIKLRTTDNPNP